jgi:phosphoglycolate phosphatase-like HAD superfamily hydrolase
MEIVNQQRARGPFRVALFDFDGTLSVLRRGWQQVMIPMAVEYLAATGTDETNDQLRELAEAFVTRLTGKQTIYQMMRLASEIKKRGGQPREPLAYKHDYHDRLWHSVSRRVESVRTGALSPEEMTVPGSEALLRALVSRGMTCYLASGTDEVYVKEEVALLGLDRYFEGRVYGALDEYRKFSKAQVIEKIINETNTAGPAIVGFGDGYVEIEAIKRVGGLAVGVASEEFLREGVDDRKRQRLIDAGADVIIGDYRALDKVLELLDAPGSKKQDSIEASREAQS